jgi:protein O-mannosyl-transferase
VGRARRKRRSEKAAAVVIPQTQPASQISSKRALAVALALATACVAVFAGVRHNDFVYYDDPKYITENPIVLAGLTSRGIAWALTAGADANWFPLTWFSHMLDVQLYGTNAGGHHVTSLLLHIINTVLLFGVLHWMTRAPGRSAFVAGLFALHPLHVESVAWVAERKDVLSTFFWMLTLWAYVWYTRRPRVNRYVLMVVFFAAGLMSKPMLVTLPFVLLLLDFWPLNRTRVRSRTQLVIEKVPLFVLAIISSIITFIVQRKGGAVAGLDAYPFDVRIENALVSYVAYIGKMLWPARLAAFYPYPESLSGMQAVGATLILIAVTVLVSRMARRCPYLVVGWLWYLGTLVPVIGLIQVGNQAMADRYMYVPLIGLSIMVAWGSFDLLSHWRSSRYALPALATLVLAALAMVAHRQVSYWRNSEALWTHALGVTSANYVAENNLGLTLAGAGKGADAIEHYTEALRIKPAYATARTNLGAALAKQGKLDEAISNYRQVIRIKPAFGSAHTNLGAALAEQGNTSEAIVEYNKALQINPNDPEAHANLGIALMSQGKRDEAITQYNEALRVKPGFAEVHNNLGFALAISGKFDDANAHYAEAIRLKPDFELAHVNLGISLANQNKTDAAMREFMEVLRINPAHELARRALDQLALDTAKRK